MIWTTMMTTKTCNDRNMWWKPFCLQENNITLAFKQHTAASCLKKKKKNLQDVYILQKFYLAS